LASGVLIALALSSCRPPIVYSEMLGISPSIEGPPEVRFAGCPPFAWSVQLALAQDEKQVLWKIRDVERPDALPRRFPIGSAPEGFREVVPLNGELNPDDEYRITLESGEAYVEQFDFSLGQLRPGYILDFKGNLVPPNEFPRRTTCTEDGYGPALSPSDRELDE